MKRISSALLAAMFLLTHGSIWADQAAKQETAEAAPKAAKEETAKGKQPAAAEAETTTKNAAGQQDAEKTAKGKGSLVIVEEQQASAGENQKVENFAFEDVEGKTHQFDQYKGKWVIVNYWATFCGPCVAEIPTLNSIAKRYKDKVAVLGLEAGETPVEELKAFVAENNIAYPIAPTQDSTMYAMGLVYGVPTTFIVNPQGEVVETYMGEVDSATLLSHIKPAKEATVAEERKPCKNNVC